MKYKNYLLKLLWTTFENNSQEPETVVWLILYVGNTGIKMLCHPDSGPAQLIFLSTGWTAARHLFCDYDHHYYHHHNHYYHLRAPVITCLCWRPSTPWRCRVRFPVKNLADSRSSFGFSVYEGKIWRRNYRCSPQTALFTSTQFINNSHPYVQNQGL